MLSKYKAKKQADLYNKGLGVRGESTPRENPPGREKWGGEERVWRSAGMEYELDVLQEIQVHVEIPFKYTLGSWSAFL